MDNPQPDDDAASRRSRRSRHQQGCQHSPTPSVHKEAPLTPSTASAMGEGWQRANIPDYVIRHHAPRSPLPPLVSSQAVAVNNQHVFGHTWALSDWGEDEALSWSTHQDGTKSSPWMVLDNLDYPERHQEFDIQWVEKIEWMGWHRWIPSSRT